MKNNINVLIYEGKSGTRVELKSDASETMWGTQEQIATIFERSNTTISEHILNIYSAGELKEEETLRIFRNVSNQPVKHYNLDMLIAVGYRVNSAKATQFRIWATKILKEYIIKGFSMDDERLKDPKANQYFDELLERIRDIRASEKLFYQKVLDIYVTAIDYEKNKNSKQAGGFFKTVQNKLVYAITRKTAAELIVSRIDADDKNFGCTTWKGSIVRKGDIYTSKNYFYEKEIKGLNRLTTMLLDYAEDQASRKKELTMSDWKEKVDSLIEFNDYRILPNSGKVSHKKMEEIVGGSYTKFDNTRKLEEKEKAEKEAIKDMEKIEKEVAEIIKKSKSKK